MRALPALLLALALVACGTSPPTRFYALEPTAAETAVPAAPRTPIKVDAVHIPSLLDRRTMVRGESHYQLSLSSQERWGADFGDMVRRVLTEDLENRLPAGSVVSPNTPAPQEARGLVVDILAFEPNASGAVTLEAEWTLLQGSPAQPLLQRNVHLSEPANGSAAGQAAAMSRLIGRLADQIAASAATVRNATG